MLLEFVHQGKVRHGCAMNFLAPLKLALSGKAALNALFASLVLVYLVSWAGRKSVPLPLFISLCLALYHVYRYKLHLVKYSGPHRSIHMLCSGLVAAIHLMAAGGFILRLRTTYSMTYAITALVLLIEYLRGSGWVLRSGSTAVPL